MRISLIVAFFHCAIIGIAQTKDAGMWLSAGLSKELGDQFELTLSPEIRLDENLSRWSRVFTDASLEFKFNKLLSLSVAYRGGLANDGVHVDGRHRLQYGCGLKRKWNDWTVLYHSRFQLAINAAWSDADVDFNTTWRNRLTVKYGGLNKTDVAMAYELFNAVSVYQNLALTYWRFTTQLSRKIAKNQSTSLGYLIQRDLSRSPQHLDYVVMLGYKVEL